MKIETRAPAHRPHRPERDVDAAQLVRRRDRGALEHGREHHRVDVGAVTRQQRDREPTVEILELGDLAWIDADAPAVGAAVEQPGDVEEHVACGPAVRRHHLAEVGVEFPDHIGDSTRRGRRQLGDSGLHLGASQDPGAHVGRGHRTGQSARVSR